MLISLKKALGIVNKSRKNGKKIVFTNGCFDILHIGHIRLLEKAAELGDILIVGLNRDNSVKRLKGSKIPINTFRERAELLSSIKYVDYVIGFSENTPLKLIKAIRPDILVKGGDYQEKDVVGREYSGRVYIYPFVKGKSTSKIIEKIQNK